MLKNSLAIIATGAVLAACNPGLPEATDEQLLTLFSDQQAMGLASIHPRVVECLELLSGDDGGLYVDLGAETMGQIKTTCRKSFNEYLQDADRNPLGFTMARMEDPDLTERVKKLREVQEEQIDELRDLQHMETLKQAKLDAAQYLERAKTFVETMEPKCEELIELKGKLGSLMPLAIACSSTNPNGVSNWFEKMLQSAEELNADVQAITYSPDKRRRFHVPNIKKHDDQLAKKQAKIEELLSKVKSQVESNNS